MTPIGHQEMNKFNVFTIHPIFVAPSVFIHPAVSNFEHFSPDASSILVLNEFTSLTYLTNTFLKIVILCFNAFVGKGITIGCPVLHLSGNLHHGSLCYIHMFIE